MNLALLLVGMIVLVTALIGVFFFLKSKKKSPLTAASIPPLPTSTEANKHFTPVNQVVAAQKKPGVNKKMLITGAVIFNIILISIVILIGQSVSQKQPGSNNNINASPTSVTVTSRPTLPFSTPKVASSSPTLSPFPSTTGVGTPSASLTKTLSQPTPASGSSTLKPTCTQMPPCVTLGTCDPAVPKGGWCGITPTPTAIFKQAVASPSSSISSPFGGIVSPTRSSVVVLITATPTPNLSHTPTPTEIIVVLNTSGTPSSFESPSVLPTIPSAGSPLSYLAIIIPALLVAIAFIL